MTTLSSLMAAGPLTPRVVWLMQQQAVEAIVMAFSEQGTVAQVSAEAFVFDDRCRHVRFSPPPSPLTMTEAEAVRAYGDVLLNVVIATPGHPKRLLAIAERCIGGQLTSLSDVHLALERRMSAGIYWLLLAVIALLLALLWCLSRL